MLLCHTVHVCIWIVNKITYLRLVYTLCELIHILMLVQFAMFFYLAHFNVDASVISYNISQFGSL